MLTVAEVSGIIAAGLMAGEDIKLRLKSRC